MKIPENAKKVFDGMIFDVYHWEEQMFDGSTGIFEMLKRANTAMVIAITTEGKIIITDEEQPGRPPFYGTPGGRLEENEDPEEGAKRELLEETGYTSDSWLLWKEVSPVHKIDWTIYTYIARNCQKVAEPHLDAGEKISIKEVTFEEFLEIVFHEKFRDLEMRHSILEAKAFPEKMEQLKKDFFG